MLKICSRGQFNPTGGDQVDVYNQTLHTWVRGQIIQDNQNQLQVKLENGQKIDVNDLNNIRPGLEWIGGIEIDDRTFNFERVSVPKQQHIGIEAKDVVKNQNQSIKLKKNDINSIVYLEDSKTVIDKKSSFDDMNQSEAAVAVDEFFFNQENEQMINSWFEQRTAKHTRYYKPDYLLRMYGENKMKQCGYDIDQIRKGCKDLDLLQPKVNNYENVNKLAHHIDQTEHMSF
eukprot:TRINITY_DN4127_c0_g1_i19.p1 TRINITY_DN4127_c0_g1~~TRINITY_DN4127_c0_g1_i19.p1  ORF type:complete len:256 (-),score=33.55 TRINITY_DN4127_c0_g1_i19:377-1066(-)